MSQKCIFAFPNYKDVDCEKKIQLINETKNIKIYSLIATKKWYIPDNGLYNMYVDPIFDEFLNDYLSFDED